MKNVFRDFKFTPAIFSLIAMNLIPLVGVLKFGWDAGTIVFLYWLENLAIGILNIPKIIACGRAGTTKGGDENSQPEKYGSLIFLSFFFSLHYGLFCFGHFMFLQSTYDSLPELSGVWASLFSPVLFWSILALALSHLISMGLNFFGKKEYLTRTANAQMFLPYSRILLLHIVIVFSGAIAVATGQGHATLILLVALKIIFDAAAHTAEHSKFDSVIAPAAR